MGATLWQAPEKAHLGPEGQATWWQPRGRQGVSAVAFAGQSYHLRARGRGPPSGARLDANQPTHRGRMPAPALVLRVVLRVTSIRRRVEGERGEMLGRQGLDVSKPAA